MIILEQIDELDISMDIVVVSVDNMLTIKDLQNCININEDVGDQTADNINVTDKEETIDKITEIINTTKSIIEKYGFYVLDSDKSPFGDSISLYFTFCDDNEFNKEEVSLIIRIRLSDHDLTAWKRDTKKQDAIKRQFNNLKDYAKSNRFLNKHLDDNQEIPVKQVYITYENNDYTNWDEVYKQIDKKVEYFRHKH